jgi:hypothetical protein
MHDDEHLAQAITRPPPGGDLWRQAAARRDRGTRLFPAEQRVPRSPDRPDGRPARPASGSTRGSYCRYSRCTRGRSARRRPTASRAHAAGPPGGCTPTDQQVCGQGRASAFGPYRALLPSGPSRTGGRSTPVGRPRALHPRPGSVRYAYPCRPLTCQVRSTSTLELGASKQGRNRRAVA